MKKVLSLLAVMAISLAAHAQSYLCIGADEGAVTIDTTLDTTKALPVVAHLKGAEVRMYEQDGILNFTLKKSESDITVVETSSEGQGFLFSQKDINFNCVKKFR